MYPTRLHGFDRGRLLQRLRCARTRAPSSTLVVDRDRRRRARRARRGTSRDGGVVAVGVDADRFGAHRRHPPDPAAREHPHAHAAPRCRITSVPAAPVPDPRSVVLKHPEVAEDKRFCAACGAPVGRGHDGEPGRTSGFCPKCRTAYSFAPKLKPGDLVGGQYEVVGCVAHGGLGWIYLARDHNVSGPLRRAEGPAEHRRQGRVRSRGRRAPVPRRGAAPARRRDLQLHAARRFRLHRHGVRRRPQPEADPEGSPGRPTPVTTTRSRSTRRSPTSSRSCPRSRTCTVRGLLYCDFKPDNVVQAGDNLKLIDLGGVRRADDTTGDLRHRRVPGTRGRRGRPVDRVRHLHHRAHARGARHGVPRLPVDLRDDAARRRRHPAVPAARLALPRAAEGDRQGSRRPLPERRRAARPVARGAARDGGDRQRQAGVVVEPVAVVREPGRDRCRAHVGRAAGAARRSHRRGRSVAGRGVGLRSGRAAHGVEEGSEPDGRSAVGRDPRLHRIGQAPGRRQADRSGAGRQSVGVARGLDVGPGRAGRAATRTRQRPRSTPSSARCPASSHRSWRWPSRAKVRATTMSPSSCTRRARWSTRRTSRPRRSVWRGCGPGATTSPARWRRSISSGRCRARTCRRVVPARSSCRNRVGASRISPMRSRASSRSRSTRASGRRTWCACSSSRSRPCSRAVIGPR